MTWTTSAAALELREICKSYGIDKDRRVHAADERQPDHQGRCLRRADRRVRARASRRCCT